MDLKSVRGFLFDLDGCVYTGNRLVPGVQVILQALAVGTPVVATTVVEVAETYERVQTATSGNFGTTVDQRTLTDRAPYGTGDNCGAYSLYVPVSSGEEPVIGSLEAITRLRGAGSEAPFQR